MPVNFSQIQIHRAVMHKIIAKEPNQEHATVEEENHLFELEDEVMHVIKERLVEASGKKSKAFDLEIGVVGPGTFFNSVENLRQKTDNQFLEHSSQIAHKLACSQTRNNIPGGFLILLDCTVSLRNRSALVIVIKAELHQALSYRTGTRRAPSAIQSLNDVFLSPSQKFFKIGMVLRRQTIEEALHAPNDWYQGFLFDDQFRSATKPAEYFYDEFLGFSISQNAKIQSKRFYEKTQNFIQENIPDFEVQNQLMSALKAQFAIQQETTLTPREFANEFFEEQYRDLYEQEVAIDLPSTFVKDPILIKMALKRKKISFPHEILLTGPDNDFDEFVQIITDQTALQEMGVDIGNTIIQIQGRPR